MRYGSPPIGADDEVPVRQNLLQDLRIGHGGTRLDCGAAVAKYLAARIHDRDEIVFEVAVDRRRNDRAGATVPTIGRWQFSQRRQELARALQYSVHVEGRDARELRGLNAQFRFAVSAQIDAVVDLDPRNERQRGGDQHKNSPDDVHVSTSSVRTRIGADPRGWRARVIRSFRCWI